MRVLTIYAHPNPDSYTAAVHDVIIERIQAAGATHRTIDLYADGFEPVLSRDALANYANTSTNRIGLEATGRDIEWCDTLIFVYPTWWYGLPAILKGWLDCVLLPGLAFDLPETEGGQIKPKLTHVKHLAVFTTCGASWWLTRAIGAPGKRTILRGVRLLCAKRCRTAFAAHYLMDSATQSSLDAHLANVSRKMDRFLKG